MKLQCLACDESPVLDTDDFEIRHDGQNIYCPSCYMELAIVQSDFATGELSWQPNLQILNEDDELITIVKIIDNI